MPNFTRILRLSIILALLLVTAQPSFAQNRGARGTSVRASAPRSAPRVSAPRSAPRASAPSRSYSAPRSSAPSRSYSAPRSSAPSRSSVSSRTSSNAPSRSYSAPRSNNNYRAPLTRQNVSTANRSSNSSYRAASSPSTSGSSTRVSGNAPGGNSGRATYPGRVNTNTTARTYRPQYNNNTSAAGTINNGQVTNYSPAGRTVSVSNGNNGFTRQPRPGGTLQPAYQPTQPVYTTNNNYYNNYNSNRQNCAPRYNDCYDPYFYSNYNCRRGYRYYQPCYTPFLSLGFFAARPYNYYDYARIDYAQPFVYGDDQDYRSAPMVSNEVASTQPVAPASLEQELLTELSRYVDANSKDQRFVIADPAFGNQTWSLDLTQAPAVYSIDSNHYSVVSGFEGTLGDNTIPSSVGLEFFVARENGRWDIKEVWIVSANGIPRAKKFQSPSYPQVQTWQAGEICPFSGQPMVPVSQSGATRG